MTELIYKNDGTPFATERSAKMTAANKKLNAEIVKVDGGYAIKKLGDKDDVAEAPINTTPIQTDASQPIIEKPDTETTDDTDVWVDSSWTEPSDAFSVIDKYKDKRFVYKWANPKSNGGTRIEDLVSQNWRIDDVMYKQVRHLSSYKNNGSSIGTQTKVRGHLLMRMPQKSANQRNEFYGNMANRGIKAEQENLSKKVGGVYGDVSVS